MSIAVIPQLEQKVHWLCKKQAALV